MFNLDRYFNILSDIVKYCLILPDIVIIVWYCDNLCNNIRYYLVLLNKAEFAILWQSYICIDSMINSQIFFNIRILSSIIKYLMKIWFRSNNILHPCWFNFNSMIKHSRPLIHNHVPVFSYNGMIGSVLV